MFAAVPEDDAQPADTTPATPRRRLGCGGIFLLALLILALLAGFLFYRAERNAAAMLAWGGRVRDAVAAITGLEPRVTVNEQVVIEQARPVLELAVMEHDTTVERETEDSWLGSTKRLRIRGVYHVKVGYPLDHGFNVEVLGPAAAVVRLQLPPPRVLSVEQRGIQVLTMDNGLWNHLSTDELTLEVNNLMMEAKLKANHDGTAAEAQRLFIEQLEQKLGSGHRIEVATPSPRPAASPEAPK